MHDPNSASSSRRAVDTQDFTAVILVGYGENLYPLNEGSNVVSKALLPVGNAPILNSVLDWIIESGLTDILIIVPPAFRASISDHISEHYSLDSHPRARIALKQYTEGEKEEEEGSEDSAKRHDSALFGLKGIEREGTARLLRRFRGFIRNDFILLPCDVVPPTEITLASILDRHRATPDVVLTSVLYEPVAAVRDGEEKLLVGLDKETEEVLLIQPIEGLEEDLELRISLITSHPNLTLTTRLLDAHIYVFRRTVLDLLMTRRSKDLDSMREQVVPWLIKGGWQKGLGERWAPILNPPRRDPFAAALARSTTNPVPFSLTTPESPTSTPSSADRTPFPATLPSSPQSSDHCAALFPTKMDVTRSKRKHQSWKCRYILAAPTKSSATPGKADKSKSVPDEAEHLVRANSLAGYWELNRRFLKSLTANGLPPPRVAQPGEDSSAQLIPPSAQVSPDSVIGEGTRLGERASIKKCVVGRHCHIGRGAKITGCVLWDFVTVEENARIENAILCSNVRIGEKATIKDCEFGTGYEAAAGSILKGERLVAGQEA